MKQWAEYDLKETDSRKQVPMYGLAMMIGNLKLVLDEVQRREIDGHWTELIAASRQMHRSIVWKANQAISSSITPAEKEDLQLKLHDLRDSLLLQQELFAIEATAVEENPVDIQDDTWKEKEVPSDSVMADLDGKMKQHDMKSWMDTNIQPAGVLWLDSDSNVGNLDDSLQMQQILNSNGAHTKPNSNGAHTKPKEKSTFIHTVKSN